MAIEAILHHSEHLKLSTVAVMVYHQVTGSTPDALNEEIVNRVAVAIAAIVPIYAFDGGGAQHTLQPLALIEGRLYAGATILRCLENAEMKEYRGLSVRRADVEKAIAGLRHARFALRAEPLPVPAG